MKANTPEETKRRAIKAAETRARNKKLKEDMQVHVSENVPKNESPTLGEELAASDDSITVINTDADLVVQDNNPAVNNGMSVNKPMSEYATTEVVKRKATPEEEASHVGAEEEPRRLVIGQGPGNLMIIKWNRGGGRVPHNCTGGWNNKQRAQDAINAAHEARDFSETQLDEVG